MDNEKKSRRQPQNNLGDNLPYRIEGLEKAKTYPEMTHRDIAALDRSIAKLKAKLAASKEPRTET